MGKSRKIEDKRWKSTNIAAKRLSLGTAVAGGTRTASRCEQIRWPWPCHGHVLDVLWASTSQDKQELEDQSLMNKLATPQVAFGAAVVAGRLKRS